jgi:hypothetical protein
MDVSHHHPEIQCPPRSLPIPGEAPDEIPAHAGYGACSVSGCHCQAYQGQDNTCVNCGHNYSMHW